MDYLISEGYPSAAQKFASEANIHPTSGVNSIQERIEVREAIHSGDIQNAIERINELNPLVRRCRTHMCSFLAMIMFCFMHHSYALRANDEIKTPNTSVFSMSSTSIHYIILCCCLNLHATDQFVASFSKETTPFTLPSSAASSSK